MPGVRSCEVPVHSLLHGYRNGRGFADCYVTRVPGAVTQQALIEAFYTSPLFKLERTLLGILAGKPASDSDVRQLAAGLSEGFSAWRVEARSPGELLLADFTGRTRSWLMAAPDASCAGSPTTLLYFGSAVIGRRSRPGGRPDMGWPFHALLGFHRIYSRLLLAAARRRVRVT